MPKKNHQYIVIGAIILFSIILLIDRYYWAQLSQWREDQATNIWLGFTAQIGHMPVGLISSQDIPNPNGMVLLGLFLSALPNLLSVSFFLGVVQIVLLALLGWKSFRGNWQYFLLAVIPSFSSVVLRSTSVEFWNQYTVTLINIFFIFWAIRYLENSSLWNIPPLMALILLAPALYLAGIVNAIVITLLTIGIMVYQRPQATHVTVILIITLLLVCLSILITWLPYFQNIDLKQITEYNKTRLGLFGTFQTIWESLIGFPVYATFQWADMSTLSSAFKHSDARILSLSTQILFRLVGRIYLLQAAFAFTSFMYLIFANLSNNTSAKKLDITVNFPTVRIVTLSALFIGLSYTFSTWLGGPAWIKGERPDQTVQFLPMFLFLIFLLPMMITISGKTGKLISRISYISLILFGTINLFCGFMIIRDHLQYRGNVLTEADVPLIDKMQLIDFVASDWKKHSKSNIIPIDYDLGGTRWDWVPEFGNLLTPWYPAPMTGGRSFDYELLREYGLTNYQEGVQLRTFGNGRYLVTYVFKKPPQVTEGSITHYIFGRLRVSIVER